MLKLPRRSVITYLFIGCIIIVTILTCNDTAKFLVTTGHSHNDYQQTRPLLDALQNRFISIEVDIHLSGQALLVGHDPEDLKSENTLQSLYLDPLRKYTADHNGWIYPHHELLLLVDIKTAPDSTYIVLKRILSAYAGMLTIYNQDKIKKGAVSVVISGNRPRQLMRMEKIRYATYDGRLSDLEVDMPPNFMRLISDNWQSYFRWRGKEPISQEESEKLAGIVAAVHAKDCMLRFWNLPVSDPSSRKNIWTTLLAAGVDLISVDDLRSYYDFQLQLR